MILRKRHIDRSADWLGHPAHAHGGAIRRGARAEHQILVGE